MAFLAGALGLVIGLALGGLGGGGGVLTVPTLVYVLGQTPHDATTGSVLIVGTAAVVGVLARIRDRRQLDWRTGLAFGAIGIPATLLGTLLNRSVAEPVLLVSFAGLTISAAVAMLIGSSNPPPAGGDPARPGSRGTPTAPAVPAAGGGIAARRRTGRRQRMGRRHVVTAAKVTACGVGVGFLTGFLGVGGGFLVVPALSIALRIPMARAIGTSLLVIVLNSASALASRAGGLQLDWAVIAPFTLAAVAGTLLGKLGADRLSGPTLGRIFAGLLLCIGAGVGIESILTR